MLRTRLRSVTWCLTQPGHARCIRAMSRSAAQRLLLVHRIHMYHVIRTHMSNKGSFITSCCSTTKTPTLSPGCACMKERGGGGVDTIVPVERERGTRRESERVREKARECERERERARESERERERARESERERERPCFKFFQSCFVRRHGRVTVCVSLFYVNDIGSTGSRGRTVGSVFVTWRQALSHGDSLVFGGCAFPPVRESESESQAAAAAPTRTRSR